MTKANRLDVVELVDPVGGFPQGRLGTVVEAYSAPREAYDVELVDGRGRTAALLEGLAPEQIQVVKRREREPATPVVGQRE